MTLTRHINNNANLFTWALTYPVSPAQGAIWFKLYTRVNMQSLQSQHTMYNNKTQEFNENTLS